MTHTGDKTSERDTDRGPWRAFVPVVQIPEAGLHRDIEADKATREAMAEVAGLREIISARAAFDLTPKSGGRVHVKGRLRARVGQSCVVTLEPLENDIDEEIDLIFALQEQIPEIAESTDTDGVFEMDDPPEPIENGIIDLGGLATDVLYLAVDPYPRKQGAVFEPQITAPDPDDRPFAALRALPVDRKAEKGKPNDE